jgi:hypothetical protein
MLMRMNWDEWPCVWVVGCPEAYRFLRLTPVHCNLMHIAWLLGEGKGTVANILCPPGPIAILLNEAVLLQCAVA